MMESNKEKVIKKIPVITSKMMNEKFLSRPSQGIQMFKQPPSDDSSESDDVEPISKNTTETVSETKDQTS